MDDLVYWFLCCNFSMNTIEKPKCRYGDECYRKNPKHFHQFSHPRPSKHCGVNSGANIGNNGEVMFMEGSKIPEKFQSSEDSYELSKRRKLSEDSVTNFAAEKHNTDTPETIIEGIDGFHWTKVNAIAEQWNRNALSLREIISTLKPRASIHFNFMIEIDWLLAQYSADLVTKPITLVVGECGGSDAGSLRKKSKAMGLDQEKMKVLAARLPLPFGSHHTKLSIFECTNSIHVLVSTANLIENDWNKKTQGLFICTAKRLENAKQCVGFQLDLIEYLSCYCKAAQNEISVWIEKLKWSDFEAVKERLVASVPGYHRLQDRERWGHLKLRHLTGQVGPPPGKDDILVSQFSSIGSLGSRPTSWLGGQFQDSLSGGVALTGSRHCLVFPTVPDVRDSLEGYAAGSSIPYQTKTADRQPYLRSYMHSWRSEMHGRSRAMPHIKTYARVTSSDGCPKWLLLTSANLSKAAWGELQKNDTQLAIRSFELGVFSSDSKRLDKYCLPFDWPLRKYAMEDEPWIVDKRRNQPDSTGARWIP